ncbi:MAG: hypothetical protein ABR498_05910, partial [Candidatus Dormibacteria bacterium]
MAVHAVDTEDFAHVPETESSDTDSSITTLPVDADIEVLGTIVLDRVAEIVELRETLEQRDKTIAELSGEVQQWRGRALSEAAMRKVEAEAALRHERELVSVVHEKMIEIDGLTAELEWRRLPWWR